jgi:hypothetical protein
VADDRAVGPHHQHVDQRRRHQRAEARLAVAHPAAEVDLLGDVQQRAADGERLAAGVALERGAHLDLDRHAGAVLHPHAGGDQAVALARLAHAGRQLLAVGTGDMPLEPVFVEHRPGREPEQLARARVEDRGPTLAQVPGEEAGAAGAAGRVEPRAQPRRRRPCDRGRRRRRREAGAGCCSRRRSGNGRRTRRAPTSDARPMEGAGAPEPGLP